MKKAYQISDLFFTEWKQLSAKNHAFVFSIYLRIKQLAPGTKEYGYAVIALLRALRKKPLLVDKLVEEQIPDIYNEIEFNMLSEPWYFFPRIKNWIAPEEKMATCTFDQFIYADNEFTGYLATEDIMYLKRLAATLYLRRGQKFDKEKVEKVAKLYTMNQHHVDLIFYTFMHVREFVVKRCKYLLPRAVATAESSEEKAKPSGPMWHEIKHAAAKTLVFGSFQKLGEANMYDVLDHLNLLAKPKEHASA